jgi:CheY-like chemotaxis protein
MEKPTSLRVLLCEDEVLIRMTSVDLLESMGMTVIEAGSAREALDHLADQPVDVLITDIGLPDLSGLDLAIETRKARPALPIIFATGDRYVEGSEALERVKVLGKPYTDMDLIGAIHELTRFRRKP